MGKFTLAYDLHGVKDRSIYESINKEILDLKNSVKLLNTTYLITGDYTTASVGKWLRNILTRYVALDDVEYIVFKVTERDGWLNSTTIKNMDTVEAAM